ncbi:LysR family transcriptional regulator [Escherichia coli]|uniref:LysR family transcriptional regulator n=1 Tax=Escherichia coli TaxID=562 RepID=A0A377K454_ECOLX|nr:LysR family transcriptional regulator [Escherichia coli]
MKPLLDVLMILDALEKEGSFAAASAKLYKTPSALSYTVHKLESDLNIQLLDRSGHRAKFTPYRKNVIRERAGSSAYRARNWKSRRSNCMKAGKTSW